MSVSATRGLDSPSRRVLEERAMEDRPRCRCHDEPMVHDGATWACGVKKRERSRRYYSGPKGRATNRRANARYRRSVKGFLTAARRNAKRRGA
jgi:hypothetical protein